MKKTLIITILIYLIYSFFIKFGPKPAKFLMQSQWQNNQYIVERYKREYLSDCSNSKQNVVIVGSSLAQKLAIDKISKCTYNLALAGDSALTGLTIIAKDSRPPKLILVEINVPMLNVNQMLIDHSLSIWVNLPTIFYTEYKPFNLVMSFIDQFKPHKKPKGPNESVRKNALALQTLSYNKQVTSENLKLKIEEFNHLVNAIESKGGSVIFFEMPVHPSLEYTPRAIQIRSAFESTFPTHRLINFNELSIGSEIKTLDGLHLHNDEAIEVTKNLFMLLNRFIVN
jgi:hypothetical protein